MKTLSRWAVALVVAGLLSVLLASWLNRPDVWRPLVITPARTTINAPMRLQPGAGYEVALEFGDALDAADRRALSIPTAQTLIDGTWEVDCDEVVLASGDAADYLRITRVRSWLGMTYRVVARVPFGTDETKYMSAGLAGEYLSERVFGAFRVPESSSGNCGFSWRAMRPNPPVRVVIRKDEAAWNRHLQKFLVLGPAGIGISALGVLLWLATRRWPSLRRRD